MRSGVLAIPVGPPERDAGSMTARETPDPGTTRSAAAGGAR